MRGDKQGDTCQNEDGFDPVRALPNLKALALSCFVQLPQRSRPGLGASVFTPSPSFTVTT